MSEQLILENGAVSAAPETTWKLDIETAVFITSNGYTLQLKRPSNITSLVLERVKQEGKPKIPMVEVTIGGKYKQLEANPNDANYQAMLEEWAVESGIRTMRYLYRLGIEADVPESFIEDRRDFFPNATDGDWKYLYIASLVPDDDIAPLTEAIISMNMPTAKGLQDAADSFRSNGQRESD